MLVANADDPLIAARLPRFAGRVLRFGIDREAEVRATAVVDRGIEGTSAQVATPRGVIDITTPLVGRGNLANILAAIAVALECDVPPATVAERAATLRPAAHRGEVVRLDSGVIVIDDSYNANPTAMKRALDVLAGADASRRIAVLGEMLELGDYAANLHADVGRFVATCRRRPAVRDRRRAGGGAGRRRGRRRHGARPPCVTSRRAMPPPTRWRPSCSAATWCWCRDRAA